MKQAVLAFPVVKRSADEAMGYRCGVEMPVGAQPFTVVPHGEGAAMVVVCDPTAAMIYHPLVGIPAGIAFEVMLGRKIGPYIGATQVGPDTVFFFRELPWPATVLEAGPTDGTA